MNEQPKAKTAFRVGPNFVGLRDDEQDPEKLFQKHHEKS